MEIMTSFVNIITIIREIIIIAISAVLSSAVQMEYTEENEG